MYHKGDFDVIKLSICKVHLHLINSTLNIAHTYFTSVPNNIIMPKMPPVFYECRICTQL